MNSLFLLCIASLLTQSYQTFALHSQTFYAIGGIKLIFICWIEALHYFFVLLIAFDSLAYESRYYYVLFYCSRSFCSYLQLENWTNACALTGNLVLLLLIRLRTSFDIARPYSTAKGLS